MLTTSHILMHVTTCKLHYHLYFNNLHRSITTNKVVYSYAGYRTKYMIQQINYIIYHRGSTQWICPAITIQASRGEIYIAPTHSWPRHYMRWEGSVTPRPRFTPGERTPIPIGQEAGWAPEPVWTQRLEKRIIFLCWESNLARPVCSQTVYWPSYPCDKSYQLHRFMYQVS
jgi:hypothetical protein